MPFLFFLFFLQDELSNKQRFAKRTLSFPCSDLSTRSKFNLKFRSLTCTFFLRFSSIKDASLRHIPMSFILRFLVFFPLHLPLPSRTLISLYGCKESCLSLVLCRREGKVSIRAYTFTDRFYIYPTYIHTYVAIHTRIKNARSEEKVMLASSS